MTEPCDNDVHAYPLPNGYIAADTEAHRRLRKGWKNPRCPDCGLYGWKPPTPEADA